MIEICIAIIAVDASGRVVALEAIGTGLQDPGQPLSCAITQVTGLTGADLSGQALDRHALSAFLIRAEACISFNAAFDRPMLDNLLPGMLIPWGFAMTDVDWRASSLQPGPQNYLLMQCGYHNPAAHSARDDVLSLIQRLLTPARTARR